MRVALAAAVACLALVGITAADPADAAVRRHTTIPPQYLRPALQQLSKEHGLQLVFRTDIVGDVRTAGTTGDLTTDEALNQLLKGTGLTYQYLDEKTVTIVRVPVASRAIVCTDEVSPDEGACQPAKKEADSVSSGKTGKESLWSRLLLTQANNSQTEPSQARPSESSVGRESSSTRTRSDNLESADRRVEEIVVTARRRQESQQDVPLSMLVRTGDYLVDVQVDSVDELSRVTPGFWLSNNLAGQGTATYALRGIGSTSGGDASVGFAMDGAIMPPNSSVFGGRYLDIDRIEVLRGPQGTLFGKNASAGLLNATTKDPTEHLSGSLLAGYGSYDEVTFQGAISGPLANDKLLGRLSAFAENRDGYVRDLHTGMDWGDNSERGVRTTFLYRPSEATRVRLTAYHSTRITDNNSAATFPIRALGPLSPATDVQYFSDIAGPTNVLTRTGGTGHSTAETRYWGSALQWDQKLGEHTLTSITSYVDFTWDVDQRDFSAIPVPAASGSVFVHQGFGHKLFTEELRLTSPSGGRVDYQAGLYFYDEENFFDAQFRGGSLFVHLNAPGETRNYAVFGEANWHLTDRLTLIAGTRWTHEKKDIVLDAEAPPPGLIGISSSATPGIVEDSVTVQNWSWRTGLQWQPAENHMLYATAARGFKGAGFNFASFNQFTQRVQPEVATTFEMGGKSFWLNRRLSADAAVYYTTFDNLHVTSIGFLQRPDGTYQTRPDGTLVTTFVLTNAGELRSQGVEFELRAEPTQNLSLNMSGAYVDAIYTEYRAAPCYVGQFQRGTGCTLSGAGLGIQDLSGKRLPRAPKYSASLGASYELTFANLPYNGFVHADYAWRSEVRFNANTQAPYGGASSLGRLNASVGLRGKEGHYTLTLYGKNLTDKFYPAQVDAGYGTIRHWIPLDYKRFYGATFAYNF